MIHKIVAKNEEKFIQKNLDNPFFCVNTHTHTHTHTHTQECSLILNSIAPARNIHKKISYSTIPLKFFFGLNQDFNKIFRITVGADLRVCPNTNILYKHRGNILYKHCGNRLDEQRENTLGEHIGSPLHAVVQWGKIMTRNEYKRNFEY